MVPSTQPPQHEEGGWRSAGARLLLMGLPFAAVFAGMAAVRRVLHSFVVAVQQRPRLLTLVTAVLC